VLDVQQPAAVVGLADVFPQDGTERPWLWVFAANRRGRRFYERMGWRPTGERCRSTFAPRAKLLRYERADDGAPSAE
jgi:RimJ/RimL family protein N-acetyltransferase